MTVPVMSAHPTACLVSSIKFSGLRRSSLDGSSLVNSTPGSNPSSRQLFAVPESVPSRVSSRRRSLEGASPFPDRVVARSVFDTATSETLSSPAPRDLPIPSPWARLPQQPMLTPSLNPTVTGPSVATSALGGMLGGLFGGGDNAEKTRQQYADRVAATNKLEAVAERLSDAQLRGTTDDLRKRVANGESLDSVLPVSFRCVDSPQTGVDKL